MERDQIKLEKKPMYFHNYLSSLERVGKTYNEQKRSGPKDANQEKDFVMTLSLNIENTNLINFNTLSNTLGLYLNFVY